MSTASGKVLSACVIGITLAGCAIDPESAGYRAYATPYYATLAPYQDGGYGGILWRRGERNYGGNHTHHSMNGPGRSACGDAGHGHGRH